MYMYIHILHIILEILVCPEKDRLKSQLCAGVVGSRVLLLFGGRHTGN